jgi:nucleoside-diphosphate-sugar epimerase
LIKGDNPMPYPESRLASDFSRSKEQLGYQPEYPIDKAVADYAQRLNGSSACSGGSISGLNEEPW